MTYSTSRHNTTGPLGMRGLPLTSHTKYLNNKIKYYSNTTPCKKFSPQIIIIFHSSNISGLSFLYSFMQIQVSEDGSLRRRRITFLELIWRL
tara:strand:+ start:463 stop:738 length:276 start_codon:yes stop_codon:yes gene_type:complete